MTPKILNWDSIDRHVHAWKNTKSGAIVRVVEDGILYRIEACDAHGNTLREIAKETNKGMARKKAAEWMRERPHGRTIKEDDTLPARFQRHD